MRAYFAGQQPTSAKGRLALARALLIQGDRAGTTITYRLNVSVLEEALWALMASFKIRR